MRSKWLWAVLALVAVLGITTAASATTRGLITGRMIANHAINSKKLVDHTIQKHDLSTRLIKSLHGERGPQGLAGPRGATGATGAIGPQGPSGVVDTQDFSGPAEESIDAAAQKFLFVGPTATVTTSTTQRLVGSAVAILGTWGDPTNIAYGLCYEPSAGGTIKNFLSAWNLTGSAGRDWQPYPAAATVIPGAGTWRVGFCVFNYGPYTLNNNWAVNGWVMVVN